MVSSFEWLFILFWNKFERVAKWDRVWKETKRERTRIQHLHPVSNWLKLIPLESLFNLHLEARIQAKIFLGGGRRKYNETSFSYSEFGLWGGGGGFRGSASAPIPMKQIFSSSTSWKEQFGSLRDFLTEYTAFTTFTTHPHAHWRFKRIFCNPEGYHHKQTRARTVSYG